MNPLADTYRPPGTQAALRWVFAEKVWSTTAVTVVEDGPDRTAIAWAPGCESRVAEGQILREKGDFTRGKHWDEIQRGDWKLVPRSWSHTRALFILEPDNYYGIGLFWDAATGSFKNYYVNFQLPFQRSHAGFDSLDLDLDIVVAPDFEWQWKDVEDWQEAKASGALSAEIIESVERARTEALDRIANRLDDLAQWRNWSPDPSWPPARLSDGWDSV